MSGSSVRQLGGSTCRVRGPVEGFGPLIVLCHGFGANADDLAPLAEHLPVEDGVAWVFPEAPLEVPIGPHMTGRAWFPIDMAALEQAMMRGTHRDLGAVHPEGLDAAAATLRAVLTAARYDQRPVVLGGFSQGAVVALEIALTSSTPLQGLALLSGTVLCRERWAELAPARAGQACLQTHGRQDPLLGFEYAEELAKILTDSGWNLRFEPFMGGHEIPLPALQQLAAFLRQRLEPT